MRGLYAIIDVEALGRRGLDPVRFAESVLAAAPAAIQLRDKLGGARRTLELLRAIAPLAARAGVPFFANDRADLALLAGCDGVHVGQDDLPVTTARLLAARGRGDTPLRIGLSTHDATQVDAAVEAAPDYVAIGPIFATASKENPSPVIGLPALRELAGRARRRSPIPVVAIGGISLANAASVGAIVDCAAVIAALLPDDGEGYDAVETRARALHAAILGAQR